MASFCELERSAISSRSELLATLEEAIHSQNPDEDLALFIAQERNVELTHKYTNAIGLMDLHMKKRCNDHPFPSLSHSITIAFTARMLMQPLRVFRPMPMSWIASKSAARRRM